MTRICKLVLRYLQEHQRRQNILEHSQVALQTHSEVSPLQARALLVRGKRNSLWPGQSVEEKVY